MCVFENSIQPVKSKLKERKPATRYIEQLLNQKIVINSVPFVNQERNKEGEESGFKKEVKKSLFVFPYEE